MFNYCPKCNEVDIDFIEQRYFHCRHCHFCYFHNIASAVAGVIQYQDKILLTTRAKQPGKGLLDLPGGFVDANESLEQALSREINEELGINLNNWQYFTSFPNQYQYKEITYNTLDSIFFTIVSSMPEILLEQSEISHSCWLPLTEINTNDFAFPSIKQGLELFQKSNGNILST